MELAILLIISALAAVTAQTPPYLITVPSIVHVGVEETVTVQLHAATKPVTITLYFEHQNNVLSDRQSVTLTEGNSYQAVVKLKVKPDLYKDVKFRGTKTYVHLVAEGNDVFGGPKRATCLLSTRKGYIFIQTDKPIYNPGETVSFRIFTLDNYMRPTDETINLKIFNSKGLMVYRGDVKSEQIYERHVDIPGVEPAGYWKIVASFGNLPMSNTSVEFEVREYVLPSFEVKIEPVKKYHLLKDESFKFGVSARYTYGKGVNGIAYVRFGIIDEQGNKTFLPGLEKQTAIQDGNSEIALLTKDLREKAESLNADIEGRHIYIAVTVLETASGELEEAESSSVKIVNSPFSIDLSKTKRYFTPEGMFSILATTTYPDGTPAPGLLVKASVQAKGEITERIEITEKSGNNDGEVALQFKVPRLAASLDIKVFANGEDQDVVLSDAHMTATATISESKSYLSVEVPHLVLQKGQEMKVTFRDITPPGRKRPTHIYYMIFSKGRVVKMEQGAKFVADSVWVDVEDVCEGQVRIQPFEKEYKPGANVDVVIHTDQAERVALVAVDTAVYILNKQNKLTAQKMFDYMNSNTRCYRFELPQCETEEGDSEAIFPGILCHCEQVQPAGEEEVLQRRARLHQRMTCEQRQAKTRHRSSACQEAFLQCCRDAAALRDKIRQAQRRQSVARTGGDDNLDALNEAFIHLRSYFPQSWMWQIKNVDASGTVRHNDNLPDSITTWEIQTIGISQGKGFCVAEPQRLKVFQDFFVSLKLPYSVKRNEQLEVKAVVYNYKTEPLEVTVKMASAEGLCTAGGGGDAGVRTVSVPANSAVPVYFTVIPLKVARIPIHVTAFASQSAADQIKKYLNVVGEGELVSVQEEYSIEARGAKVLEIDIPEPADAIPGLESAASISIRGGVMGESADNCLNLEGIDRLIELPTGCAEQTMVKMSPAINAMKYLDATDQWLFLSPQRRGEAKAMIQSGYTTVLTHMKNDGSYGAFKTTPSSIWLTAFIAKELTRARDIIAVEDSYILRSVSYLVSKQQSNGAFTDPNPVYDRTMQGGVGGVEGDVSLTAFVLVTMVHSVPVFPTAEGTKTRMAMMQAQDYLAGKLDSLQRPFAEMAVCDDAKGTCHWEAKESLRLAGEKKATRVPKADSISVETTAYALLAALSRDEQDLQHATKIARWLTEQRQYGGGFRSTQDTVVALEALAALSGRINDVEDLDLNVELCLSKSKREKVRLTKRNALTQPSFQAIPGSKVTVDVTGTGNGTLSLLQTYRSMKRAVLYCDYYQLSVSLEGEVAYQPVVDGEPDLDDYYNYEAGEAREEPMDRVEWFDLRTRRKRHAPSEPERETSLIYTVCVSMKGRNSTGMAIVDISLLSGLEPNMQDLEDQVKGTEKYIDHYDLGKNKVYLYFNQITENTDCVTFGAKQITPMGLVQPASAVIYDYYNPDRRCSVFYSAPQKSTMLSKLCSGDVCACAEGHCPKTKVTFSKNMQEDTRKEYACFSPVVSYVYVVKVLNSTEDGVFQYYTVTVTRVLQIGPDETVRADAVRELVQRKSCDEFQMKSGRDYLVMGGASTVTRTRDANGEFRYLLSNEVWVEEIPEERKCQATKNRNACQLLNAFMEQYELQQCAI
ncbi:hypothetical protein ANANG_G00239860 [Anguilla anguilla]|uniref:NTR domain-containing protein n=2 Tax=Anguilla anguilla TaxID=7936 RepID=A0A9D3RNY0_ANGAN|nr:hypothetical protein ANANG_G00239860 [Anguilla anguilla]